MRRESTEEDAGVGANPWLGIRLSFGEMAQEIVVENLGGKLEDVSAVQELSSGLGTNLGREQKYRLDRRLSNDGHDVREPRELRKGQRSK